MVVRCLVVVWWFCVGMSRWLRVMGMVVFLSLGILCDGILGVCCDGFVEGFF